MSNAQNMRWTPECWGVYWHVSRIVDGRTERYRSDGSEFRPVGRIVRFKSEATAQDKANELNRDATHAASSPT